MRMALIILVCMVAFAMQASGATRTNASTNSLLVSTYSDLAVARTISESSVTAPDLNYKSNGQVDSYVTQPNGGSSIISQGIYSSAENNGMLGGMTSFHAKVTATNVKDSQIIMTGTSSTEVCNKQDNSKIQSQTFGLGMAKPGEGEYSFATTGNQQTVSNMVPALKPIPVLINDPYAGKDLVVTFTQDPLTLEKPADFMQQNVDFNYGEYNSQPTFFGYDFSSTIGVEDTSCSSYMSFSHVN
jgi:hypothetical protein